MPMPTMVTDRDAADVGLCNSLREAIFNRTASPSEWAEWLGLLKGAYNAADLNRVGTAINYIAQVLNDNGYAVSVTAKTNWAITDVPNIGQMAEYLQAVEDIRSVISSAATSIPLPDSMDKIGYAEANNIERILSVVDEAINNMLSSVDSAWAMGIAFTGLYAKEAE